MKAIRRILIIALAFFLTNVQESVKGQQFKNDIDYIPALIDTLNQIVLRTDNKFLRLHCESIIEVVNATSNYTEADIKFLKDTYIAFNKKTENDNLKEFSTYQERQRNIVISWVSPTDGQVSFTLLKFPSNWDPEKEYPLYVNLHGLWNVASNSIEYMTYYFLNSPSSSFAFKDGYSISPWGRGNHWYEGISETDIWECISKVEEIIHVDPTRKYLSGHSMGGYGAWRLAYLSSDIWAAIGIHAGAIWYSGQQYVSSSIANELANTPTYFTCGDQDANLHINQTAYSLLEKAGNKNLKFATFPGGHDYHQVNVENMYTWMRNFTKDINTNVAYERLSSPKLAQLNIYPNSFSSTTTISYNLPETTTVQIEIYNSVGQLVETIINKNQIAGDYRINWTPKNLTSKFYYCRMKTSDNQTSITIINNP